MPTSFGKSTEYKLAINSSASGETQAVITILDEEGAEVDISRSVIAVNKGNIHFDSNGKYGIRTVVKELGKQSSRTVQKEESTRVQNENLPTKLSCPFPPLCRKSTHISRGYAEFSNFFAVVKTTNPVDIQFLRCVISFLCQSDCYFQDMFIFDRTGL